MELVNGSLRGGGFTPKPTRLASGWRARTRPKASRPSATPFQGYSWKSISTRSRPSSSTGTGRKSAPSTGVTTTAAGVSKRSAMMSASHVEITIFRSGMR